MFLEPGLFFVLGSELWEDDFSSNNSRCESNFVTVQSRAQ